VLRLHDTALGNVVEVVPREPGRISMYVCGPTVYGVPHIGHGRTFLVFDVLRRYLEWSGFEVTFIENVTDVDDKIIQRAREEETSTEELAARYEAVWWDVMDRLGVKRPTAAPHAVDYIAPMVDLVAEMVRAGLAYETPDGVYLDVSRIDGYGLLARQSLESLRAGARVEVGEDKRSPLDFALWKKAKPGEPQWKSPFGPGRPGWHTECVVMSLDLLGEDFDLHGGGLDLSFPHHENERAQAVGLGRRFCRHWMHGGMVEVEGEKMSKSLGNFTSLVDLLDHTDPRAYRLLVLRSHYRRPLEVTPSTLADAGKGLERLDAMARQFGPGASEAGAGLDEAAVESFRQRMDADLDTPAALAGVFELVREANRGGPGAPKLAATAANLAGALGLELRAEGADVDAATAELVRRRDQARSERDFATADAIRDELEAGGWTVEDTPEGTKVRR
jgi:cysteinyl-tRNA synthetase